MSPEASTQNKNRSVNREYWEKNIGRFAQFYDHVSEESILGPRWFASFYRKFVFPIEAKYMKDRFDLVSQFLNQSLKPGMKIADIGCGSGIFLKRMLELGAEVVAIDYTESALELARKQLGEQDSKKVRFILSDITADPIPKVDVAISIGVLTYIDDLDSYLDNILPYTDRFLFNFIDQDHPLNMLRRTLSFLDVRKLSYHRLPDIEAALKRRGFEIVKVMTLATGKVVHCKASAR